MNRIKEILRVINQEDDPTEGLEEAPIPLGVDLTGPEALAELAKTRELQLKYASGKATRYLFNCYCFFGVIMPKNISFPTKVLYVIHSLIINVTVTLLLPFGFFISYFTLSGEDLNIGSLLTSIQVSLEVLTSTFKFVIMSSNLHQLRRANAIMEKLDKRCFDPVEIDELRQSIRECKRIIIFFFIAYLTYSTSTFISEYIRKRPSFDIYNPFVDWRASNVQFQIEAIFEWQCMNVACAQQVLDDSYAVLFVRTIRGHVRILLNRFSKLGSDEKMSLDENYRELKQCVKDHKDLLEVFNILAPLISTTIFIQFLITAIVWGTTLINILIFSTDLATRCASLFYMFAVNLEIFPLCYHAQCLLDDSQRLADSIFHSNWMYQDARYRKMLVFLMQRTQTPMELTAGKLFPITLGSYVSIAKFSFTLYTFIKEMDIKERFGLE